MHKKLRGRIIEIYGSVVKFSEKMGLSYTSTLSKLNGKSEWTMPEVAKACHILDIPFDEISIYFL